MSLWSWFLAGVLAGLVVLALWLWIGIAANGGPT